MNVRLSPIVGTDAVVIGAGPAGLTAAYQLRCEAVEPDCGIGNTSPLNAEWSPEFPVATRCDGRWRSVARGRRGCGLVVHQEILHVWHGGGTPSDSVASVTEKVVSMDSPLRRRWRREAKIHSRFMHPM